MENSSLPDQSLTDNHTPLNFQSIMEESYVTSEFYFNVLLHRSIVAGSI